MTGDVVGLFPEPERVEVPVLSDGARRTRRQRERIAAGIHPLMGGRITATEGGTCGSCAQLVKRGDYLKCRLVPHTNGPGTDARRWWPGCTRWEAAS